MDKIFRRSWYLAGTLGWESVKDAEDVLWTFAAAPVILQSSGPSIING